MDQDRVTELIRRVAPIFVSPNDPSEQRGAGDIPLQEKITKLTTLLQKSPARFLERYSSHLIPADLALFEPIKDAEVEIQVAALRARFIIPTNRNKAKDILTVKNRRFNYLGRVLRRSDYFSLENMRERQPYLYEQYMERKMVPHLRKFDENTPLSDRLLASYDAARVEQRRKADEDMEMKRAAEEEEDEDEEDAEEEDKKNKSKSVAKSVTPADSSSRKRTAEEVAQEEGDAEEDIIEAPFDEDEEYFRQTQFQKAMEQRFLSGADTEWVDYKTIDADVSLDDLEQQGRDAEDKYFDED